MNLDAGSVEVGRQHFAEAGHRELRRCVRGLARAPDAAGDRRDVDDVAVASREHRRQDGRDRIRGAEVVDPHRPLDLIRRQPSRVHAHRDAGVVDQQVDRAVSFEHPADELLDGCSIADVGHDRFAGRGR